MNERFNIIADAITKACERAGFENIVLIRTSQDIDVSMHSSAVPTLISVSIDTDMKCRRTTRLANDTFEYSNISIDDAARTIGEMLHEEVDFNALLNVC